MGLFDAIKMGAGAVAGFALAVTLNALWWAPVAEREARASERLLMEAATNKAIGELSNEADKARFSFHRCRELGQLYSNRKGGCIENGAAIDG